MARGGRQAGWIVGALGALLLWPSAARGQALSAQLNPGYALTTSTTTDETGHQVRAEGQQYLQKYRLSLDEQPWPLLKLNAGTQLDWTRGETSSEGVRSSSDDKKWSFFSGLRLGSPVLSGGLDLDWRGEASEGRTAGVTTRAPQISRLGISGNAGWRPADLPTLDLRLGHSDTHDADRQVIDLTVNDAALSSRYQLDPTVQLQYGLRGSDATDHRSGVTNSDVSNSVSATWSDQFAAGRGTAYLGYNLGARASDVTVTGADATARVLTRQLPVAGLSIVDALTTTPDRVTLNPNPALVDGDTVTGAGLNLGTSASAGAQGQPRELGAQLPNLITPVNVVDLWIKDVPIGPVAGLLTFSVWQSDDNVTWTRVADPLPASAVAFSQVPGQPYFRLTLPATVQARYLKVVTRPLPAAATTDPQLADIPVTELQLWNAVTAAQARGHAFTLGGSLSATARYQLLDSPSLAYDSAFQLSHSNRAGTLTWSLLNGLSLQRRLGQKLSLSARADRSDGDAGRGHEAVNRWSATVSAELLPTLGGGATYSGLWSQGVSGRAFNQAVSTFVRADLYEGIGASANGTASSGTNAAGQATRAGAVAGSLALTPNRRLSLNASISWSDAASSGGGQPDSRDRRGLLDLSGTFAPVPALSLTGALTRFTTAGRTQTLSNFSASASPFVGGTLQLRYGYQETLDVSSDTRTRSQGPGLRWNVRPGWFLDAAYSLLDTSSAAQRASTQGLFVNLLINLH